MLYWIFIIIGSIAGIVFTGLWKKESVGTSRKNAYALIAYVSYAVYLVGFIGHLAPMIEDKEPSLLFVGLLLAPIIMFAIVFFEKKEKSNDDNTPGSKLKKVTENQK